MSLKLHGGVKGIMKQHWAKKIEEWIAIVGK